MRSKIKVAFIYDFDGTLSAGNMQEYDFIPAVGKSNREFWQESNRIAQEQDADPILAYMHKMLHEAKSSGHSLKREAFRASGAKIALYEGVEEWFDRINGYAEDHGIEIAHYINSSGIKEMIEGTPIARHFRKIYACSFLYDIDGVAYWPALAVNYTNKTQFIFKINKGVESVFDSIEVNRYVPDDQRPVPFSHMIYFGDGTTDIPCMKLVKQQGGHSIAVYDQRAENQETMLNLIRDNRVNFVCQSDYSHNAEIDRVVKRVLDKIAIDNELKTLP